MATEPKSGMSMPTSDAKSAAADRSSEAAVSPVATKTNADVAAEEKAGAAKDLDGKALKAGDESPGEENTALSTGNAPGLPISEYVTAQDLAGNRTSEYKTVPPDTTDPADRSEVIEALHAERKLAEEMNDAKYATDVDRMLVMEGEDTSSFVSPETLAERRVEEAANPDSSKKRLSYRAPESAQQSNEATDAANKSAAADSSTTSTDANKSGSATSSTSSTSTASKK